MIKHQLLVDYDTAPGFDLSVLDANYSAIIFVGAYSAPAATKSLSGRRFRRIDFQKATGPGKSPLDFHLAFYLGRAFETSPATLCTVVSRATGIDPLLQHLNSHSLSCRRVESFADIAAAPISDLRITRTPAHSEMAACTRCGKFSAIDHYGRRWCTSCGAFASLTSATLRTVN